MKRFFNFIILACLTLGFARATDNYTLRENISYTSKTDDYSRERLKLDILYPEDKNAGHPVIIWFHGGGLTSGEKHIPEQLRDAGYVVVAPNYRLVPNVKVEDCIDDAAEAIAWVFNNITEFGGDTSKIVVSGHSAGGFLTSMTGLDKSRLEKYDIDADEILALFPFSGQVITHFSDRRDMGIDEKTPLIDRNAPLYHVRKDAPPYIIITGDAEQEMLGRYEENLYMWRMMKINGHPDTRIYKLDGYDHGQMAAPAFHILKSELSRILKNQ